MLAPMETATETLIQSMTQADAPTSTLTPTPSKPSLASHAPQPTPPPPNPADQLTTDPTVTEVGAAPAATVNEPAPKKPAETTMTEEEGEAKTTAAGVICDSCWKFHICNEEQVLAFENNLVDKFSTVSRSKAQETNIFGVEVKVWNSVRYLSKDSSDTQVWHAPLVLAGQARAQIWIAPR